MTRAALPCALAALCGCLPNATLDGLEFACDAGAGCDPGFRCWQGVCTQDAGWGLGAPCAADDDCENRTCSGGVCCSRRCDGACEACDRGAPGQCDLLPAGDPGSPSCAPYHCDGASTICPGGCLLPSDCGPGTYCDAGTCAPLQALGTLCGNGGSCDSGLCVDGRCCNSTCANPCDACNVAGRLGTCSTSPLGRVPSPACGDFACNGTSALCPTSCTSDGGCLTGLSCSFSQQKCQPKVQVLVDSFTGTGLDAGTWTPYAAPDTRVAVNGRLELVVDAGSQIRYCGIYSTRTYDATNSRSSAQLVLPGDQAGVPTFETYFQYQSPDGNNRLGFTLGGGALYAREQSDGGSYLDLAAVAYDPAAHKFLRLRLDGGIALLETSADAGSYAVLGTTTTKPWMQSVLVELGAGDWDIADAGTFSAWDAVRP